MGILIIFILGTFLPIVYIVWRHNKDKYYDWEEGMFAMGTTMVCGIFLIVSLFIIPIKGIQVTNFEIEREVIIEEYESCIQLDNSKCDNALSSIKEFNTSLRTKQYWAENFWIGIYTPSKYLDIETIDINEIVPN